MKIIKQTILAIVFSSTVNGCAVWNYIKPKPELIKNLPNNISLAETKFDRRIKQRFLVGSSERKLIQDLKSQGFQVNSFARNAVFKTSNLACRLNWIIRWETDELENLTEIVGKYNTVCL